MGWGEQQGSAHAACDRVIAETEAERDAALARLLAASRVLRAVHDLSLLPFDDNDRREIGRLTRTALDEAAQEISDAGATAQRVGELEGALRETERRLTWALDWIIDDDCPVDSRDYRAARSVSASARALLPDSSPHERRGIKSHLIRDGGRCPRCGALCNELVCMCTPEICNDLGPGALD